MLYAVVRMPLQSTPWPRCYAVRSAALQSKDINEYIREGLEMVREVDATLSTIKDNVQATRSILQSWERNSMFERKEGKVRPWLLIGARACVRVHVYVCVCAHVCVHVCACVRVVCVCAPVCLCVCVPVSVCKGRRTRGSNGW